MVDPKSCEVFKALSDPNRMRILELLVHGETCACTLLDDMNFSQPTLSHHMKILVDAGLVSSRKEGKWVYYKLVRKTFDDAIANIASISERI